MAHPTSIPPELELWTIEQWKRGHSTRAIAADLYNQHGVQTTHTSVQRLTQRASQGECTPLLAAAVARLRRDAPFQLEELDDLQKGYDRVILDTYQVKDRFQLAAASLHLRALQAKERLIQRRLTLSGAGSPEGLRAYWSQPHKKDGDYAATPPPALLTVIAAAAAMAATPPPDDSPDSTTTAEPAPADDFWPVATPAPETYEPTSSNPPLW